MSPDVPPETVWQFITTHQTDSRNQTITVSRPPNTTEVYTVSYPTFAGFPAAIDLHFATSRHAGLTDQVLLAIVLDRLEHRLQRNPDGPDSADKAWQIALQCLMSLPPFEE